MQIAMCTETNVMHYSILCVDQMFVWVDGHGLVLEENRIEPNQTVFKIYYKRTETNCLSLKSNC
jgi:hypothetical protein